MSRIKEIGVAVLVDTRRWQSSRWRPEFNSGNIGGLVMEEGIKYVSMKDLGPPAGLLRAIRSLPRPFDELYWREYCSLYANHLDEPYVVPLVNRVSNWVNSRLTVALMCVCKAGEQCHRHQLAEVVAASSKIEDVSTEEVVV